MGLNQKTVWNVHIFGNKGLFLCYTVYVGSLIIAAHLEQLRTTTTVPTRLQRPELALFWARENLSACTRTQPTPGCCLLWCWFYGHRSQRGSVNTREKRDQSWQEEKIQYRQPANSFYECCVFVWAFEAEIKVNWISWFPRGRTGFLCAVSVAVCRETWEARPGQCRPYLECRSWCECCSRAQRRSDAGCLATPGRTPSSRGETAPPQRGTIPPSCWWASRLRWGRGTARGWAGEAPPRYSSMLPESHCSSWDCTSLQKKRSGLRW